MQDEFYNIRNELGPVYINEHNVMFIFTIPSFIVVSCRWPGFEGHEDLSIFYICDRKTDFLEELGKSALDQHDQITPQAMLQLVWEGHALVVCAVDGAESLEFRKTVNGMMVTEARSDESNLVIGRLYEAQDFVEYTRSFFARRNRIIKRRRKRNSEWGAEPLGA